MGNIHLAININSWNFDINKDPKIARLIVKIVKLNFKPKDIRVFYLTLKLQHSSYFLTCSTAIKWL